MSRKKKKSFVSSSGIISELFSRTRLYFLLYSIFHKKKMIIQFPIRTRCFRYAAVMIRADKKADLFAGLAIRGKYIKRKGVGLRFSYSSKGGRGGGH